MIWNIIDRRKRQYRWMCVDAIIEATFHDNSCSDSDQAPALSLENENHVIHDRRDNVNLAEAIKWANNAGCPVTLYIYDQGGNSVSYTYDADTKTFLPKSNNNRTTEVGKSS